MSTPDSPSLSPFHDGTEHVLAALGVIDLRLRAAVARAREGEDSASRFKGLYISEEEIDVLLTSVDHVPRWVTEGNDPSFEALLEKLDEGVSARAEMSERAGVRLPLLEIQRFAGLSSFDVAAVLVCLAPEIDLRYEKLFAYLHDDMTRRRPSVDLLLNLLSPSLAHKLAARARFFETAPLLRARVLEPCDDPSDSGAPLLAQRVRVDPRVARFLLGSGDVDPALAPFVTIAEGALAAPPGEPAITLVHGPRGAGKKTWAKGRSSRLVIANGEALAAHKDKPLHELTERCLREAWLQRAALYWEGFDALLADDKRDARAAFLHAIARAKVDVILSAKGPWDPGLALAPKHFSCVEVPRPDPLARHALWTSLLGPDAEALAGEVELLAGHFRFTPGQIEAAVRSSRDRAGARGEGGLSAADLYAGCYGQADRKLAELARKVPPRRGFGSLVLPQDSSAQLTELSAQIRYRHHVLGAWGFDKKLMTGKCVTALFAGPSGTGKTMAASLIAGELGLDLYKIDLSSVVSKYIGETEKNLSRVFDAAETGHAVLFFDEADALFGKRSEVKDAHDRYANIEVGYLLQRIEEHEGIILLATNLRRNVDEAFVRRMSFVITFPFPEEAERLRIWRTIWPEETPRRDDIDFASIARSFKLAGGNIRNAALAAAFFAASKGEPVSAADVVRGVYRELQKMGRSPAPADFGPHAAALQASLLPS